MSGSEKSAWGLLIGLVGVAVVYFPTALEIASAPSAGSGSLPRLLIGALIVLIIFEIIYHSLIGAWSSGKAAVSDERDRYIDLVAERNSGVSLSIFLVGVVIWIIASNSIDIIPGEGGLLTNLHTSPMMIAVNLIMAITAAEIIKLASQIWFYRVGIQ